MRSISASATFLYTGSARMVSNSTAIRSGRHVEQLATDQDAPDLLRSRADLVELRVPQQPPRRKLVDVAVAAQCLDRFERHLRRAPGREQNTCGRILRRVTRFLDRKLARPRTRTRGSRSGRAHIRDLCLHELEGADRALELFALVHVWQHQLQAAALMSPSGPPASTTRS